MCVLVTSLAGCGYVGIELLVVTDEPTILTRVANRHSRRDLDVPPELYGDFVDALVETVAEYDTAFTPEIGEAWRKAIAEGVAYMQSKH